MKSWIASLALAALTASPVFTLDLRSPDFLPGAALPRWTYGTDAGGDNRSPALSWKVAEKGVRSLALVCVDEHPAAEEWVHWMAVDLPPTADGVLRGQRAPGRELTNTFGEPGWGGPTPPAGTGAHRYAFHLYALTVDRLPLQGEVTWRQFLAAVKDKVAAEALLVGIGRP